jgi:hypothetical protein
MSYREEIPLWFILDRCCRGQEDFSSKLSRQHHFAEDTRAFRGEVFLRARLSCEKKERVSGGRRRSCVKVRWRDGVQGGPTPGAAAD